MAIENLELIGGNLCLDFTNTVGDHLSAEPGEWLRSYADLASWGAHAGAVEDADALLRLAAADPVGAAAALNRAITLREVIYRLLLAVIWERAPDAVDLAAFNRALS